MNSKPKILITGVSGFIGYHLCLLLLQNNYNIVGLDNLNDYYDINLKKHRLKALKKCNLNFYKIDITNSKSLAECVKNENPQIIIHLAAQAGVRYSIENPKSYIDNNIYGFFNILEVCKTSKIEKLIFASSSSVYGNSDKEKFSEDDKVEDQLNLYSVSKKSNELMANAYANLYKIPSIGLRFFTVYGPWGRPDMAYFKFTKNIIEDIPIDVYGNGNMYRDFTYVSDIVEGILKLLETSNKKLFSSSKHMYEIFNIGNNNSVNLNYFISILEKSIGKKAKKNFLEVQPGDVKRTSANIIKIQSKVYFSPQKKIEDGIPKFVEWYKKYYQSS